MTRARPMRYRRTQFPTPNFGDTTNYVIRGMVDVSKVAVGGMVIAGTIGAVGSLLKK